MSQASENSHAAIVGWATQALEAEGRHMLFMGLFWIGLIVALVWGVGRLFPRERRSAGVVAREAIRRRYASGEISEAEYLQAIRALGPDEQRPLV